MDEIHLNILNFNKNKLHSTIKYTYLNISKYKYVLLIYYILLTKMYIQFVSSVILCFRMFIVNCEVWQ